MSVAWLTCSPQVLVGEVKSALLDGDSKNYDMERGFSRHVHCTQMHCCPLLVCDEDLPFHIDVTVTWVFCRHPIDETGDKGIIVKLGMPCIINRSAREPPPLLSCSLALVLSCPRRPVCCLYTNRSIPTCSAATRTADK